MFEDLLRSREPRLLERLLWSVVIPSVLLTLLLH
jgi:hypothetical protein